MKHVAIQGCTVPAVGLGTWQLTSEPCVKAVAHALTIGYRHIDTAQVYGNESEVGCGFKNARVEREEVFLTTKIAPTNFARDKVIEATHESLKRLRTEYVDLLLLHWPSRDIPIQETLGAMLELREVGKIRHIGLSNFRPRLVEEASRYAPIFCNQVEYHPYLSQSELLAQARDMNYLLTAYCPIALGEVVEDDLLCAIGDAHGKTAVQVTLRWLIQQANVAVIPKAASDDHQSSNLAIFDFELCETEMEKIHAISQSKRLCIAESMGW